MKLSEISGQYNIQIIIIISTFFIIYDFYFIIIVIDLIMILMFFMIHPDLSLLSPISFFPLKNVVLRQAFIIPSAASAGGFPDLCTFLCAKKAREDYGEELRKAICYVNGGGAIAILGPECG